MNLGAAIRRCPEQGVKTALESMSLSLAKLIATAPNEQSRKVIVYV